MGFTLEGCLGLSSLLGTEVVTGKNQLGKSIKKVSYLESTNISEIEKYCKDSAQLVIATFSEIKNDVIKQCKVIETLAKNGNVGLVLVRVGTVLPAVDDKVISIAKEYNFPIIISGDRAASLGDIIAEINRKIFYGSKENFQNRLISNSIFHLLNFEKYDNFQTALREAAIANEFQAIIISPDFNPILSIETRHKASITEVVEAWRNNANKTGEGVYTAKDINGVLTYWGPINIGEERNFLLLVDNNDYYTVEEIAKLAEIIEISALMWKYTPENDSKAEIIKALRRGNRSLAYTLNNEAKIEEKQIISVFYIKGLREIDLDGKVQEFIKKGLEFIRVSEGLETYGIILSKATVGKKNKEEERQICLEFYSDLDELEEGRVFQVTGIEGIEGAIEAYQLINETSHFVESVYPKRKVFSKFELSLVRNCVGMELQGGTIKKTYLELLKPLGEVGEVKEKQLIETLETFILDTGLNNNKTAEVLNIHANTVQYRLKRADDLLGAEISTNRIVPSLTVALALRRLNKNR